MSGWKGDGARLKRIADAQGGRCAYCCQPMIIGWAECHSEEGHKHPRRMSRDHVVPRARGGGDIGNELAACLACNGEKADRYPTLEELAFLASINAQVSAVPSPAIYASEVNKDRTAREDRPHG